MISLYSSLIPSPKILSALLSLDFWLSVPTGYPTKSMEVPGECIYIELFNEWFINADVLYVSMRGGCVQHELPEFMVIKLFLLYLLPQDEAGGVLILFNLSLIVSSIDLFLL
jgi:hypothetical protein